jgi:feruloyl esterase
VDTARRFYAPVRHPANGELVMSGLEPGTEAMWRTLGGPQPLGTSVEAFRYVVFGDERWDWRRFNLASDLERASRVDNGVLDSSDPDLRPFFERGGKLLLYHGWSDPQIPAGNTIDFFDRVLGVAGPQAAGTSVQLYMVPGMNHCSGGSGVDTFDTLGAMDQWLVTGHAPARIPAARVVGGVIERTRPLCPYGQVAEWNESGSISDASAFTCVVGATQPAGSGGDAPENSR